MKTHGPRAALLAAVIVAFVLGVAPVALAQSYPIPAAPIPNQKGAEPVEAFIGAPATSHPVAAKAIPQNPYLSAGSWGAIHDDTYQSDTYPIAGPLGVSPTTSSTWLGAAAVPFALCVGMTFDAGGAIVAAAIKVDLVTNTSNVVLTLIDPDTLATLATLPLPGEAYYPGYRPAGVYFYQDQLDRTVVGTMDRTVWVVSHKQSGGQWTFSHDATWDLTAAIDSGDAIEALAPDFDGRV